MFISKKAHELQVKFLEERLKMTVETYEFRLRQQQERIEDLKRFVFSPTSASEISVEQREADAVLSGTEKPLVENATLTDEQIREMESIIYAEHEELYT